VELSQTKKFLKALTGHEDCPVTWQVIPEQKGAKIGATLIHGPLTEVQNKLIWANEGGCGIFLCVNETDLTGRREDNVVGLRALFCDFDGGTRAPEFPVPPAIITHSANGDHCYWPLLPGEDLSLFTQAQEAIAARWGSDPSVKDLPRVMRVPGFMHCKSTPTIVTCDVDSTYALRPLPDLVLALGSGVKTAPAPVLAQPGPVKPPKPDRIARYMAKVEPAVQGNHGDEHTFKVACKLVRGFGLSDADALAAMRQWNQTCEPPWSDEELSKKISHARKYGKEAIGGKLSAVPVVPSAPTEPTLNDPHNGTDKLPPIDVSELMLRDHNIVKDFDGSIYIYRGNKWTLCPASHLEAIAIRYESRDHVKGARLAEISTLLQARVQRPDPIKFNRMAETEIPFNNGVYDVATGEIRPHRSSDWIDKALPHDHVPGVVSELWNRLLGDWFDLDDDAEQKKLALQEFFGYILLNHSRYKKALMMQGNSDCGKSVVVDALRRMVGNENTCQISVESMGEPRMLAPIRGKMLNLLGEIPEDAIVADGGFKQLVSTQEPILIDEKYLPQQMIIPTCKHVFATNNLPTITDKSMAFFNRLLLIKFNRTFALEEQDMSLGRKLEAEIPGILNWAVDGAARLTKNGGLFTSVPSSQVAVEEYREDSNPVLAFIEAYYERVEDEREKIEYRDFITKFNDSKMTRNRWNSRAIISGARALGIESIKSNGKRFLLGLEERIGN
jgi:P4 family phage/plasmid primase-like protien